MTYTNDSNTKTHLCAGVWHWVVRIIVNKRTTHFTVIYLFHKRAHTTNDNCGTSMSPSLEDLSGTKRWSLPVQLYSNGRSQNLLMTNKACAIVCYRWPFGWALICIIRLWYSPSLSRKHGEFVSAVPANVPIQFLSINLEGDTMPSSNAQTTWNSHRICEMGLNYWM